jgi:hypothetical protein
LFAVVVALMWRLGLPFIRRRVRDDSLIHVGQRAANP